MAGQDLVQPQAVVVREVECPAVLGLDLNVRDVAVEDGEAVQSLVGASLEAQLEVRPFLLVGTS